ncbi:MAG TPA: AAA family ATPase [Candidatus Binatia bacterium]|nr:AAA family ATPase [Candidatus Binatia bacterium]
MYNEHFGFLAPPFSATPDSRIFYDNELYREAFANLRYGIEWRKGLILLTGDVGTGKTTLLDKIIRDLGSTIQVIFISYDQLNSTELIQLVSRGLGLVSDPQDRVSSIEQLRHYLIAQFRRRHIVALLIDEAQNLSDETFESIRFLSNFQYGGEKLLQIVLTGQPELQIRLNHPKLHHLKQRIVIHSRLTSLTNDEVSRYITFRVRGAGFRGKDLFDAEVLADISLFSGGIPRLINIICDNALLLAYADGKKTVTTEIVQEVARDLGLANRPEPNRGAAFTAPDIRHSAFQTTPTTSSGPTAVMQPPRRKSLAWVPIGLVLALLALGGAGGGLYSQQIKGYLGQVAATDNHPAATLDEYQNRPVRLRTSESELSLALREGVTAVRAKPEDLPKDHAAPSSAPNSEQPQPQENSPKKRDSRLGTFEVVGQSSFVRGSPRADAKIIATLEPSTRIKVVSARGDYLQVQAVFEGKAIRGYVHREDAFFERPTKDKRPPNGNVVSGVN